MCSGTWLEHKQDIIVVVAVVVVAVVAVVAAVAVVAVLAVLAFSCASFVQRHLARAQAG